MTQRRNVFMGSMTLIVAAGLLMPVANADPGKRDGQRGGPPTEAFEACAAKVEGDACSFSGRRGDVEGSCIVPPRGEESLVCLPADAPPKHTPPDEKDDT